MKCTDRKLIEAIKAELLECFNAEYDGKEMALSEIRRYKKDFSFEPDYNIYQYGNIRPYYTQIRALFEEVGHHCPDSDTDLCDIFKHYIKVSADELLKENR